MYEEISRIQKRRESRDADMYTLNKTTERKRTRETKELGLQKEV